MFSCNVCEYWFARIGTLMSIRLLALIFETDEGTPKNLLSGVKRYTGGLHGVLGNIYKKRKRIKIVTESKTVAFPS